jgi:hypothetical protein
MAEIFWLRGGAEGHRQTSRPHHVPIDVVEAKLVPFEKRYLDEAPDLAPGRFAHDDAWHVFVRVNEEETNSNFPEQGYYQVIHVTPDDCRELFGFGRA